MESILEYITLNYTWFLVGAIVILLAIIGYYADKTNFGQGKSREEENELNKNDLELFKETQLDKNNLESIEEDNVIVENNLNETKIEQEKNTEQNITPVSQKHSEIVENKKTTVEQSIIAPDKNKVDLDKSFEKLNKEFDELLPKKDIIDDELLDEIDSLSLDKTQKLNLTDIPDLDDVELPKIKSLKSIDEDIWKF